LKQKKNIHKKAQKPVTKVTETGKTRLLSTDDSAGDSSRFPVLVVVSGNLLDVGRILPVENATRIIGRDANSDFPLNDRLISRRHLEIVSLKEDEKENYSLLIRDLQSTNGTFVKGKRITEEWLRLGETIEIGSETILLFRTESFTCIQNHNLVLSMVSRDSLTGVYNRRAFDQLIEHIHEKFKNTNNCYSLLLIDVDHFKIINDTFGHPSGDRVLKAISALMRRELRAEDIVARLGGDEFAILLPKSNVENASKIAERLLKKVRQLRNDDKTPLNLTLSIGISADQGSRLKTAEVYRQADVALYKAKQKGRDNYMIYSNPFDLKN
jgi:two-component system, cell cycle response regulator